MRNLCPMNVRAGVDLAHVAQDARAQRMTVVGMPVTAKCCFGLRSAGDVVPRPNGWCCWRAATMISCIVA